MPSYLIVFETAEPLQTPLGETDHIALQAVEPINIEPRHTAPGLWSVETAGVSDVEAEAIEQFAAAKAQTKIYVSDEHYQQDSLALTPGPLHNTSYREDTGELELEGEDAGYYLLADSNDVRYQNEFIDEALRDYWGRVDGFDATVDEPEPQIVAEDVPTQTATDSDGFETIFDPLLDDVFGFNDDWDASTVPIRFGGGGLDLLPTGFYAEGEESSNAIVQDDVFSGGEAAIIDDGSSPDVELDFSTSYTIPAGEGTIAIRSRRSGDEEDDPVRVDIELDGETVINDTPLGRDLQWRTFDLDDADIDPEDITPGSHTVRVTFREPGNQVQEIDGVAFVDNRFDYEFDNEVHEPGGALDGPELYPDQLELTAVVVDAGNLIDSATLSVEMTNTQNNQRLGLSLEGSSFRYANNSETLDIDNDDTATTTIQGRIRLSRSEPDGPRDETPRFGYEGQTVTEWELTTTLSSRGVIEDQRFEASDLDNIEELCSQAGYRFVLIPDESTANVQVRCFQRGTWELEADWKPISRSRNLTTEDYWNAVTVKGPRDDETGERPTTPREDPDEIDRVGERLELTEIRNDLDTEADRATVATEELLAAVDQRDVTGQIEAAPTLILPGPRYYVEAWDAWVDLETVRYSDQYGGGNVMLDFDKRAALRDRLDQTQGTLSREQR